MSDKTINPVTVAVGAALATSLAGISVASAGTTPFAMTALSSGYMADVHYGEVRCLSHVDLQRLFSRPALSYVKARL